MRVISSRQPGASAIIYGAKTVEIRSWTTRHRGPILIHATKDWDLEVEKALIDVMPALSKRGFPLGGIIGVVSIDQSFQYVSWEMFDKHHHLHRNPSEWYVRGKTYGWMLSKPRPMDFVACIGQQGIWHHED